MTSLDTKPDDKETAPSEWLYKVAERAWQKTANVVKQSYEDHPVLTVTAGVVASLPLVRYGTQTLAGRLMHLANNEIHTASPYRTLIPMSGYGKSKINAIGMEGIIGKTREEILSGGLNTGREVEDFIANRYFKGFVKSSSPQASSTVESGALERAYDHATAQRKHRSYAERVGGLVGSAQSHQAQIELGGRLIPLIRTHRDSLNNGACWELIQSATTKELIQARKDKLFSELLAERQARSQTVLNNQLQRVAEMEWLSAQHWRYDRGSAGISQLQARTWLEVAHIDSGKFRKGIDPNLEALTRSLPDYKANYANLFKKPPKFFEQ